MRQGKKYIKSKKTGTKSTAINKNVFKANIEKKIL